MACCDGGGEGTAFNNCSNSVGEHSFLVSEAGAIFQRLRGSTAEEEGLPCGERRW